MDLHRPLGTYPSRLSDLEPDRPRRTPLATALTMAAVVLSIVAGAIGFAASYGAESLTETLSLSLPQRALDTGKWVAAGFAAVVAYAGIKVETTRNVDFIEADAARSVTFPLAMLGIGYGAGSLYAGDAVGWFEVLGAVIWIWFFEIVRFKRRVRAWQKVRIRERGIDTRGIIVESDFYETNDSPRTEASVRFKDSSGAVRHATETFSGNIPVGTPVDVRYVFEDPGLPPIVEIPSRR